MIVYQLHISTDDEAQWEDRLALAEPATQVFTRIDAQTICIEATFPDDITPTILQAAFGGSLKPLIAAVLCDGWEPLPAKIGSRFLVIDSVSPTPETERTLLQMVVGEDVFVGHRHPTTLACLRMMHDLHDEEQLPRDFRCLDVGCGNGLLGITAGLLGANQIDGFDLCEDSINIARTNAARYKIPRTTWKCATLEKFAADHTYALVVANLFSDLLEGSFDSLQSWLAPNGHLIVSGILERFKAPVLEAAQLAGLDVVETRQRGPWVTAWLRHSTIADD